MGVQPVRESLSEFADFQKYKEGFELFIGQRLDGIIGGFPSAATRLFSGEEFFKSRTRRWGIARLHKRSAEDGDTGAGARKRPVRGFLKKGPKGA